MKVKQIRVYILLSFGYALDGICSMKAIKTIINAECRFHPVREKCHNITNMYDLVRLKRQRKLEDTFTKRATRPAKLGWMVVDEYEIGYNEIELHIKVMLKYKISNY